MKKKILLLVSIISLLPLLATTASSQVLTADQISNLLANRTFLEKNFTQEKTFQLYFSAEGKYKMVYPSKKTIKTGKWTVEPNGDLCMHYSRKKTKASTSGDSKNIFTQIFIKQCGKIVRNSQETFQKFDEEGNHIATLQFSGNGNLLDID